MQGIDTTFDGVSFDRERSTLNVLRQALLGTVALASIGCVAAYIMRSRPPAAPDVSLVRPAGPPAAQVASNSFGEMIIEPGWAPKTASPSRDPSPGPGLDAVSPTASTSISQSEKIPLPSLEPVPSAPPAALIRPENVPLPPTRDVARIDDSVPLPPPRPPEFGEPVARPAASERLTQPGDKATPAPGDNLNFLQRLLGAGRPPTIASAPPRLPASSASPRTVASIPSAASSGAAGASAAAQPERTGGRGFFGFFSSAPNFDRLGYDRLTAVYDISARTVYLPDGTRLEAHSGLGPQLDDPRYVSERMRGPTPPHLYELQPREASFHGVQALRLNPIGEDGMYGRAGLLAHPYMLGPNGDSNGCVSFKDYATFLRAYQSGEIKRLAVVAKM